MSVSFQDGILARFSVREIWSVVFVLTAVDGCATDRATWAWMYFTSSKDKSCLVSYGPGIGCLVLDYPAISAFISLFPPGFTESAFCSPVISACTLAYGRIVLDVHRRNLLSRMFLGAIDVKPPSLTSGSGNSGTEA